MLNDQKVGINNMNVGIKIYVKFHIMGIKIYVKFHIMDIVVITFHEDDFYCDQLSPA